jgi:hypothetical protein
MPRSMKPDLPLYPSEAEIARAVLGADRAKEWPAKAVILERRGLPPINPLYGGRFWPAVVRFFHIDEGLDVAGTPETTLPRSRSVRIVPLAPDGEETFDAEKAAAVRSQRRDRRTGRART